MVVGQKGEDSDQCDDGGGGGGGGTFVAILDQGTDQMAGDVPADLQSKMVKPLLVAGGGGGNDDDAFWNCQQVSADGMDGGLDSSGGSAAYDGGGCNSNGAGFRGDDANNGYTKTFLTGSIRARTNQLERKWRLWRRRSQLQWWWRWRRLLGWQDERGWACDGRRQMHHQWRVGYECLHQWRDFLHGI